MIRNLIIFAVVFVTSGFTGLERAFLPQVELFSEDFLPAAETAQQSVDHGPWDAFLAAYLETDDAGINRVDYANVTQADSDALDGYIGSLESVDTAGLTRPQQLAYWINLYNAVTVDLILENYPIDSIRDIGGFLEIGPWDRKVVEVAGHRLTLNDIEHRIIRPIFEEPRIHYAVNCAAAGCPNLKERAWRAETLEADLAAAERAYVNDPRGVRISDEGELILSKIFGWFREDFGRNEAAVIAQIAPAAEPDLRRELEGRERVDRYEYDWSLNEP